MSVEGLIEFIVSTYDLEPRIKNKVLRIAKNRVGELRERGFCRGFDDIYKYIGEKMD